MSAPPLGITARAHLVKILDGDTIDVELRLPARVRLLDCWAPEIHGQQKPLGDTSKQYLESIAQVGSELVVHVPTSDAASLLDVFTFGRVLGNVWRKNDNLSLSQLMVASGHATLKKVQP